MIRKSSTNSQISVTLTHEIMPKFWGRSLLTLTLFLFGKEALVDAEGCVFDVCVAVERHESVTEAEWEQMLDHVALFSGLLDIETLGSRVALVSYDAFSTLDIPLDRHSSTGPLQQDIRSQVYGGSGRDISGALFRMHTHCFDTSRGDRAEVPNYAILISSGRSEPATAVYEAGLLRSEATILSVGIGPDMDYNLLVNISANPAHVFALTTFAELAQNPALYLYTMCPEYANFPAIPGAPALRVVHVIPENDYHFECTIQYPANQTSEALYQVTFMLDGVDTGYPVANLTTPHRTATLPGSHLNGNMGKSVSCVVRSSWIDQPLVPMSPPTSSIPYYVGILTKPSVVTISEVDDYDTGGAPLVGNVTVFSTVPVLCPDDQNCHLTIRATAHSAVLLQQQNGVQACSFTLGLDEWSSPDEAEPRGRVIRLQPKQYSVRTPHNRYVPVVLTLSSPPPHWQGYQPQNVDVHIIGSSTTTECSATYDPNVNTFDGHYYGFWTAGIYRIVEHRGNSFNLYIDIATDPANPEYICGIAIKSGNYDYSSEYPGHYQHGQTHILDRCLSDNLNILRCHPEDHGFITLQENGHTYEIRTTSGVRVTVDDKGNRLNVYIYARELHSRRLDGLCGNFNGNPDDDFSDRYNLPLEESAFLEYYSIQNFAESKFDCQNYENITTTLDDLAFCQCENQPLCVMDDSEGGPHPVQSLLVANSNQQRSTSDGTYSDDVIYDYQPPIPHVGPIHNPTRPAWGSNGVDEQQAEDACMQAVMASDSHTVCQGYFSDQQILLYLAQCKSDIQVTGDLSWAQQHVTTYQTSCQHNIQMTVNVTDPENPTDDPEYSQIMDQFKNTTCANNCSSLGYCNRGACVCNEGYMGVDCSLGADIPPSPSSYTGPVTCDVLTQPCTSTKILASNLVRSDQLSCKVTVHMTDGTTRLIDAPGELPTPDTIKCSLLDLHQLGNSSHPAAFTYSVAISNNQVNYATTPTEGPRTVWHSDWMWKECLQQGKTISKASSCIIESLCVAEGEMQDTCYGCHPEKDSHSWTPAENMTEETNLSPWSGFSECSKDCDYGLTTRTRVCTGGCCGYGALEQSNLCATTNCPELDEELKAGIILSISGITMEETVSHQKDIIRMVTDEINKHNGQNPAEFCKALQLELVNSPTESDSLLTADDTYTAQGYPTDDENNQITLKLITTVHVSSVDSVCDVRAKRDTSGDTRTLDGGYMMTALAGLEQALKQEFNQDIGISLVDPDPEEVSEDNIPLILATVIPYIVIIAVIIGVIVGLVKNKHNKIRACNDPVLETNYEAGVKHDLEEMSRHHGQVPDYNQNDYLPEVC